MAQKYLVPCECGANVAASAHQAGSQIACSCGKLVDIPPLRKLRELPLVEEAAEAAGSNWAPRQAVAVGGVSLLVGLLVWAGYLYLNEPVVPDFNEGYYAENIQGLVDNGSPLQFWQHWMTVDQQLAAGGFEVLTSPQREALKAYAEERILFRNVILSIAGVVALLTLVAWFALPGGRGSTR